MKKFILVLCILAAVKMQGQNVGIGTTTPNASAQLDITSNGKGLLVPRLTTSQRGSITTPAKGLIVYDSTSGHFWYYDKYWRQLSTAATTDSNLVTQQNFLSNLLMNNPTGSTADSSGYIYDSGGPSGNYGNSEYSSFQINFPPGSLFCKLQIISFATESPYDSLRISNPANSYTFYGNVASQTLTFRPEGGNSITLLFQSNAVNTEAGYTIRFDHYFPPASSSLNLNSTLTGFYYIPEKIAIGGGIQTNNNWHRDSVGLYSFSYGYGNQAKGAGAVALGETTKANGQKSIATGAFTIASGHYSTAMGSQTTASGLSSTAMGSQTTATNWFSTALGYQTTASGMYSTAMGHSTSAFEDNSTAMGYSTTASGMYSTAMGSQTTASGVASFTAGINTRAKAYGSYSLGVFNEETDNPNSSSSAPTDRIFQIGNGTSSIRSNAITVLRNGNTGIGIISPSATLDVVRGATAGATAQFRGTTHTSHFNFSTNEDTYIRAGKDNGNVILNDIAGGKVGIGTSTPNAPLQFANTAVNRKIVLWESANNDNEFYGFGINGFTLRYQTASPSDDHVFYSGINSTASAELMRIKGNGNAGIGTNNPTEKLQVAGNVKAAAYKFNAPKTYYYAVDESSYTARDGSKRVDKGSGPGGAYMTAGDASGIVAPVNLPHGAVINRITVFMDDVSAVQDLSLRLKAFNGTSYNFLATVTSSGSSGYQQATTTLSHVVDNTAQTLSVTASPSSGIWNSFDLTIKKVVIEYTLSEL